MSHFTSAVFPCLRILTTESYFDTEENLALLAYCRHISYNPVVGDIDVGTFKVENAAVNRRFPFYLVHINNVHNSNAREHSLDLAVKVQTLLDSLKKMQFKFTSKGTLSGRKINYIFHETEVDVTDHVDSKEYKQMRLLVACCHSIKEKEKYKKPDASPPKENDEVSVVPLKTIVRSVGGTSLTPIVNSENVFLSGVDTTESDMEESNEGTENVVVKSNSTPPKRNSNKESGEVSSFKKRKN